jgi:hypothetical protein
MDELTPPASLAARVLPFIEVEARSFDHVHR